MLHKSIALLHLKASDQPRPLITAAVDKLALSMGEIGLIQPITVRATSVLAGILTPGFQIVAGHHRVAAARALGWTEIDAMVIDADDHLTAELIEIDENLCRSELTASQRSGHVKRRKVIWEALHPEPQRFESVFDAIGDLVGKQVAQVAPPVEVAKHGHAQEQGFAAETAAITGESKSQINRHVARADALGDDLPRVTGTSLDKGVELDALAKLPELERSALIDRAEAGEKVSARHAPTAPMHPQPAIESPADFLQRFAFEMRLAMDAVACAMGCKTNAELAQRIVQGIDEAEPGQLVLLDRVLNELNTVVRLRATH
ncbi:MAG: ParB N-terminal domain-containing protein [Polaromonas sp.]